MKLQGQDEITNGQDIIDSRDVIARIEWLEGEREALSNAIDEADENEVGSAALIEAQHALADFDAGDEGKELKALQSLAEEAEGYCADWQHGEALIRDSYFEDYARQLAEDVGAISGDEKWPCDCIDWQRATRELQMDYTSVDFDGTTYWTR